MLIASFTEREVIECSLTVVGELDHNGSWLPEEIDVAHGLRLEADEDDEFEDDDLEDDDLEDDDLEDEFEDEDDFEDDDDFDDEDDFEDDDDLDDADDDEDY